MESLFQFLDEVDDFIEFWDVDWPDGFLDWFLYGGGLLVAIVLAMFTVEKSSISK